MAHDHHGHHDIMTGHQGHTMDPIVMPLDHSAHGGGQQGMHGMPMYFHLGFEQFVLFEQWSAQTVTTMLLTCIFYFVLAILYEILKAYRRVVALRFQLSQTAHIVRGNRSNSTSHGQSGPMAVIGSGGDSAGSSISAHSSNGHQKLVPSGTSSTYVMDPASPTPDDPTVQVIQPNACHPSYGIQGNIQQSTLDSANAIPLFSTFSEMYSVAHLSSTLLYMLQVLFAYLLMLAFMLFNVWICLAILFGAALGHFFLAHKAIALQDSANEDYCH